MATTPIKIKSKLVRPHKSIIDPAFNNKSILVENPWEYVELWIKRKGKHDALFYWYQARGFYRATKQLPNTSAPLAAYYCFLNATKALLEVKDVSYAEKHGVTGEITGNMASLSNELIKISPNGILSEMCRLFGEVANNEEYTFKNLIYNLNYVHRAYDITYSSDPELFFPISNPHFVKISGQDRAYFQAEIVAENYKNGRTINKLPSRFERDMGVTDKYIIRRRKRFKWKNGQANKAKNLERLKNYNNKVRRDIHYIVGSHDLWYFKRGGTNNLIDRNPMCITFALMHRLSELSRYNPLRLKKHFDNQQNWLLSEFINLAPKQFIYGIACEITGKEFKMPGIRK
ncbi:hypothetical protein J1N09_14810 [Aureitalea sp. L0-47]|uniref:YaaC family protein n=1 Tax=Aureitalea sp. L0-47 TaxID=2816962 RepID=UPI0022375FD7|nr:YaaC family protein [Aureitalea sp. L0-47]MCW5521117.1 hypothetical protein [Aureitalea sp. L0-47]